MLRPLAFVLLLAACAPETPPETSASAPSAAPLAPETPPPQAAPAVLLAQAETFAARLDSLAALPGARVLSAEQPASAEAPPRRVTFFAEGTGQRITVTEPDDAGQMTGTSDYYLDGSALVFVRAPFARYAFARYAFARYASAQDSLAVWADEHGRVLHDLPASDRAARARALRADAARYRALFPEDAGRPGRGPDAKVSR
ncbi:MAG: hypothetical protein ACK41D_04655 [Rubricoccaceae bacterium]